MAYLKTDWVNNVTPVDEARMDKIEQGIFDAAAFVGNRWMQVWPVRVS